eukprot:9494058-Pyramimonas_sp.AAC.1
MTEALALLDAAVVALASATRSGNHPSPETSWHKLLPSTACPPESAVARMRAGFSGSSWGARGIRFRRLGCASRRRRTILKAPQQGVATHRVGSAAARAPEEREHLNYRRPTFSKYAARS